MSTVVHVREYSIILVDSAINIPDGEGYRVVRYERRKQEYNSLSPGESSTVSKSVWHSLYPHDNGPLLSWWEVGPRLLPLTFCDPGLRAGLLPHSLFCILHSSLFDDAGIQLCLISTCVIVNSHSHAVFKIFHYSFVVHL